MVYPNPASDSLLISKYNQVKEATVYDSAGRKVLDVQPVSAQGIDLARFNAGIYTVKITLLTVL
ncbi:T9SS type A sorting domain-containing protein [Dyadobacter alkalitolerans]|uniref:T9SS type A sorting domain-containing protein n=1 Tax=Dyadobacter alkalitolerans TaxID=492736 RepID=UPI0009FC696D